MTFHEDLLEQARFLARRERSKPKQISLRRSVSAAYYALFHFLVGKACDLLVSRSRRSRLHGYLSRAFHHEVMAKVCAGFASARPARAIQDLLEAPPSRDLVRVGQVFIDLQQSRIEADYDRSIELTRREALAVVDEAEHAIRGFLRIQGTPEADTFLAALLVQKISRA
ncbi:MAG: hypothetical protein IPN34_09715 [Planctomycetes bacterium]|nr:hypothetical protein [Planctomycetota bacterium]